MNPFFLVLSIVFVCLCWSLAIQSQCKTHPFPKSVDECPTDAVQMVKTKPQWNQIYQNAHNLEVIEELNLKDTVKTTTDMKEALELVVKAFKTQKFPSGHLAEFVNHVRAWILLRESRFENALFVEDTVTQQENFVNDFKDIVQELRAHKGPRMVLLGPNGATQAYVLNRAMASVLLEQLEKSHAKDFLSIGQFFNLQCKGGQCDQAKLPLVTRNENVLQRFQNLIHIQIGNAKPQGTLRNRS